MREVGRKEIINPFYILANHTFKFHQGQTIINVRKESHILKGSSLSFLVKRHVRLFD